MQANRKRSKKRDTILEVLTGTKSHPSAQWIYEQAKPRIPDLSLGTVYRNLSQFQEDGLAISVGVVGGELRYDGTVEPHPHFVCERCGAVIDLATAPAEAIAPAEATAPAEAATPAGAAIDFQRHQVDFRKTVYYGKCAGCLMEE